jgi:hypothetical protein
LTTRTPLVASSTTPATSAARCWASHVAGKIDVRRRNEMATRAGSTASATSVSGGDSTNITAKETTRPTTLPTAMGRNDSSPCNRPTSELARDTS